ncbi:hypothetical protein RO21_04415 [[Actinobacillus] muris]|uniref:Uncharacterized protein n=1 Tax=Muribacter muris TaxID=67855 RepID=A0A0J5P5Y3_9PAST|nr:hypothetical protein [Muribacter muris]KMK51783.1 hypothetical protein RO21_04415 [[Actinobacillus] muris] [Muribacter muris]
MIILVLDFIGDYETVMLDEEGSRDIAELIGRIGMSFGVAVITKIASEISLTSIILMASKLPKHPAIMLVFFAGAVVIYTAYKIC